MGTRDLLFIGLILGGAAGLGASLYPPRLDARREERKPQLKRDDGLSKTVAGLDRSFRERWKAEGLEPATRASDLTILRRLAIALTGSIPSLEELRRLEKAAQDQHIDLYLEELLGGRRFADYLAERLARVYVGTEGGPFLHFRRRRFGSWLSDQLIANRPYDQIVRDLIAAEGLWTDQPATNFITVTYDPEKKAVDPERLAGRVARAFIGARIDCAQCHDHPFARWKQADFRGLAAFFGQAQMGITGIHDAPGEFKPTDRKTGKDVTIAPRVPFLPELLPGEGQGDRRERLARWVIDPKNPSLPRATVNRVWALLLGRPLVEPIDEVATADEQPEALTILAEDFAANGYNLRRLIRAITASEVFRLDSTLPEGAQTDVEEDQEKAWAVFPITRLRPEQVVGGIVQAGSLTTIDAGSPLILRVIKYFGEAAFVSRYGDMGEDEFDHRAGTIPQRLLMMNGEVVRDRTKPDIFSAGKRIALFAPNDRAAVEVAYLTVLTRKPSPEEARFFMTRLADSRGRDRSTRMSDLIWALVNSTEFSWNH